MLLPLSLVAVLLALACFAVSMRPHWRQLRCPEPQPPRLVFALRVTGSLALAASFLLCLATAHASMAVLLWVMLLAFGAVTVAMLLAWWPNATPAGKSATAAGSAATDRQRPRSS